VGIGRAVMDAWIEIETWVNEEVVLKGGGKKRGWGK
jgi:hypothetical protein